MLFEENLNFHRQLSPLKAKGGAGMSKKNTKNYSILDDLNRREFIKKAGLSAAALCCFGPLSSFALAEEKKKLVLIGHRVHMAVASGGEGKGIDLIKMFEEKHNCEVIYHTYSNPETHEKLFRLGPLKKTDEDIFHILQPWATPVLTKFLEPLGGYLKSKPIDGWPEDWAAPMVKSATIDGQVYMIPIRAGCWCLWYNQEILKSRGFDAPPKTPEELYEMAKACTWERSDGTKVYGWSSRADLGSIYETLIVFARMIGGDDTDFITPDFKLEVTSPPIIKALETWQKMFKEGIMPPDMFTYSYAQNVKMFQEGRTAMIIEPSNYWPTFNNPQASKISGNARAALLPLTKGLIKNRDYSNGATFVWFQGILRGSQRKDLAWEYIRFLASKKSALEMAKSGNSPARLSVLSDPEYTDPAAEITAKELAVAREPMPAFPKVSEAIDIIGEHCQNVCVQGKPAEDEMKKAAERIKPLLP